MFMNYQQKTKEELISALQKLEEENKVFRNVQYDLNERVKELTCHNQISQIINQEYLSLDEILGQIVKIIPPAWQFPELTQASLVVNGKTFETNSFRLTKYVLTEDIKLDGIKIGEIRVCYDDVLPISDPVFLQEEKNLIFSIAVKINNLIDRDRKAAQLFETENNYRFLIEGINDIVYKYDSNGILNYISPVVEKTFGFTAADILGKNFIEFVVQNKEYADKLLTELREKGEIHNQYRIPTKTGEIRWANLSTKAIFAGDTFLGGAGVVTDITERIQFELELKKSELLYRSILDASPDPIAITTLEGKILLVSGSVEKVFGFDTSFDFVNRSILEFIDENEHEKVGNAINLMFQNEFPGAEEYKGLKADGSLFDIEVNGEFIRDENGQVVNIIFVIRDITQRKQAAKKLNEAEESYRNLIENINDVIYNLDKNGVVKFVSPTVYKVTGYRPEELVGRHYMEFFGEDPDLFPQRLKNLIENGSTQNEYQIQTKSGETKWVRYSTRAVFENNVLVEATGTLIDITEQKQVEISLQKSEALYSSLVSGSPDAITLADLEGNIIFGSPVNNEMFGYDPSFSLIDHSVFEFISQDEHQKAQLNLLKYAAGILTSVEEYKGLKADGSTFDIEVNTKIIRNETGKPSNILLIVRDISSRKLLEEKLRNSEELFRNLVENLNEVVYEVSTDGIINYMSPSVEKLLGYKQEELIGKSIFKLVQEVDKPVLAKRLSGLEITESQHDYRFITRTGKTRWLRKSTALITKKDNKYTRTGTLIDVTEQKLISIQLSKSEENYRLITEKISDVVWLMDLNGNSTFVSHSVEKFTGYTVEEYKKQTIRERFTPESAQIAEKILFEQVKQLSKDGFETDYSITLELDYNCKNGTVKTGELLITPMKDNNGKFIGMHGVTRDITERRKTERELRESEERYRNIFETVQDAYYEASIDGILMDISPSIETISSGKIKREEIVGKSFVDLYRDPNARSQFQQEMYLKGKVVDYELEFMIDDSVLPVAITSSVVFDSSGHPLKIIGSIRDISVRKKAENELRKSEALYSSVLTASPDDIVVTDLQGIIELISPVGVKMFGYQSVEQIINTNIVEFIIEEEKARARTGFEGMYKGIEVRDRYYTGIRQDGSTFPMEVNAEFIRDIDGNPERMIFVVRDITDRKRAEEALILSEEKYKSLIESSDTSIIMVDPQGNYLYANSVVADLFGFTVEEIMTKNIRDLFPPEQGEIALNRIKKIIQTGKGETLEHEVSLKDRKEWFKTSFQPILNKSGEAYGVLINATNINELKKTEKSLRQSELRYKTFFEDNTSIMLLIDPQTGDIKDVNPAACQYYGWSNDEMRHKNIAEINTLTDDEISAEMQLAKKEARKQFYFKHRLANGEIKDVEVYSGPMEFGETTYLYSIIHDITDRVKAEKELVKFRTIADQANYGVFITSMDGVLLYVNQSFAAMLGREIEELQGQVFNMAHNEEQLPRVLEIMALIREKGEFLSEELYNTRKDGSVFPALMTAKVVFDEQHVPQYMSATLIDITERKQTEAALRESENKFRSIAEQTSDLIAITDNKGVITYASSSSVSVFHLKPEEMIGRNFIQFVAEPDLEHSGNGFRSIVEKGAVIKNSVSLMKRANGEVFYGELNGSKFQSATQEGVLVTIRDITERKLAEEKIAKLNRLKTVISNINEAIITEKNKENLLQKVCQIAIESGKFQMAWIGLVDKEAKLVKPHVYAGYENGYLSKIKPISVDENNPESHGPTGTSLRVGKFFRTNNIENDPIMAIWKDEALKRNYRSAISMPIKRFGEIFGSLTLYSSQTDFFNDEETELLVEVMNNIGNALEAIESELERKRAEDELRKLSRAVEQSPVSIVITNLDGDIEYANPKAEETTGFTLTELIGKNPRVLQSGETPKDEYSVLWETIGSGKQWHGTFHNKKKTGELYWESSTISAITNEFGVITNYLAVKEDITEKKKAEEELIKFQTISDRASYGTAINTLTGEFVYLNQSWAEMHGYEVNELIGQNLSIGHNEEQRKHVSAVIEEMFRTGEMKPTEIWHIRKDGSVFPTLMSANVIYDAKKNPLFLSATCIEISDMKKTEEALRSRELDLNYAQEIAKMGSWEHNFKTNQLTGSVNYYKMLGLNPEIERVDLYDCFIKVLHPDDYKYVEYLQQETFKEHKTEVINMRIILSDGVVRWYQNNVVPIFEDEKLVGLRGVNIDITEQKLKDDQINKLSLAVEQSPILIVITDLQGKIEYVNPVFTTVTGYTAADVIGKSTGILKSGKTDKSVYKNLWETITSGKEWHHEWINKKKNGEFYWENVSITPLKNESGEITNYVAVKQDISERKKSEQEILDLNENLELKILERTEQLAKTNIDLLLEIEERKRLDEALIASEQSYQTVVENVNEVIFQTDADGLWLFLNKSWEEITGFTVEESLGQLFLNYVLPEDREQNKELFMPLINREKEYCRHEIRYKTKDGGFRWIEVFARLGLNEKNEITGTYGTLQDITERKNTEQIVLRAKEEAEKANLAKSEFLSRMSHELRTPMNSILGFAQILEMGNLNQGQQKGVHRIMESGKHLLGLINEVLDISRIEAGRLSLSNEPIKLDRILDEMMDVVRPLAFENEIKIELIESPSNEMFVWSDRQSLKQIMLNLLNNAIKYNKKSGSVSIKTQLITSNDAEFIKVLISDTGIGISNDDIPKLFTPFERIDAYKTGIEGTGLGLTVVKKLVEAMGGTLGVESEPGVGSTFWFELPHTENQRDLIQKTELYQTVNTDASEKSGTILYIEDNVSNIELVEQILLYQRPGIRLISNLLGLQAVNNAIEYKPNLILLDLNLADIHGSEVLKMLQKNKITKNIPVVIISADAMNKQIENMLHAGAKAYLTKPLEVSDFLRVIDELV